MIDEESESENEKVYSQLELYDMVAIIISPSAGTRANSSGETHTSTCKS